MATIKWVEIPDSDIRAEVESVLESSGEDKKIREELASNEEILKWKQDLIKMCEREIEENGLDELTPDILYNKIEQEAFHNFPASVKKIVIDHLNDFLQTQFEDHI